MSALRLYEALEISHQRHVALLESAQIVADAEYSPCMDAVMVPLEHMQMLKGAIKLFEEATLGKPADEVK